jgi:dihydroorotase
LGSILIESAKIPTDEGLTTANLFIEDGAIKKISRLRPTEPADLKIAASRLIALPGMIDAHVHLRDLEFSYKETFETGTRAAAVGGFTTVLDMPNSKPATINASNLAQKMEKAHGRLFVNVGFQGSLVRDPDQMRRMADLGAIAFKIYLNKAVETFNSGNDDELLAALQAAKEVNALVTVHAEDGDAIHDVQRACIASGKTSIKDFLTAHAPKMEADAVRRILNLTQGLNLRLHICHITIPEAVKLVKSFGATCEATAHHLLLNENIFKKQRTLAICVPPIRPENYRAGLWREFIHRDVDILASDHAPHTLEEKSRENVWDAASGVPGLETSLPLLFTQFSKKRITLKRLVEATATRPARIFRLPKKGALTEGYDADIVLVNPKKKFVIRAKDFMSKAKYSPFEGMRCVGRAEYTIVNGTLVSEHGEIVDSPAGRIVKAG